MKIFFSKNRHHERSEVIYVLSPTKKWLGFKIKYSGLVRNVVPRNAMTTNRRAKQAI